MGSLSTKLNSEENFNFLIISEQICGSKLRWILRWRKASTNKPLTRKWIT